MLPKKLLQKLVWRKTENALRQLSAKEDLVDFSSNDYLGFANSELIFERAHKYLTSHNIKKNGARGSRLLSGNTNLHNRVEQQLETYHNTKSALLFNSGYDANLGVLSTIPQRGDVILFDELVHASIRDGISLSYAKSYKFKHNDLDDLKKILKRFQHNKDEIYIITESVFSMDGDSPNLKELITLAKSFNAHLIIDEAHAVGVFDFGLVQQLSVEQDVFIRIITFGKALGCHGAAVLCSQNTKDFLINFSRPFIYTTALPPHSLATILEAYKTLEITQNITKLQSHINFFNEQVNTHGLSFRFIKSNSAIQSCLISGNTEVKTVSHNLISKGFDVKAILSPTVPVKSERLRICLHSYNSEEEISEILRLIATFVL